VRARAHALSRCVGASVPEIVVTDRMAATAAGLPPSRAVGYSRLLGEGSTMSKAGRFRLNALICVLVLAHAIWWFLSGQIETASTLRTALVVAQAVLGLGG